MEEKEIQLLLKKEKKLKLLNKIFAILCLIGLFSTIFLSNKLSANLRKVSSIEEELFTIKNTSKANEEDIAVFKEKAKDIFEKPIETKLNPLPASELKPTDITEENVIIVDKVIEEYNIKIGNDKYTLVRHKTIPISKGNVILYALYLNGKLAYENFNLNTLFYFASGPSGAFGLDKNGEFAYSTDNVNTELLRSFMMSIFKIECYKENGEYFESKDNPIFVDFRSRDNEFYVEVSSGNSRLKLRYRYIIENKNITLINLN